MTPNDTTLAWMRSRADGMLGSVSQSGNRIATWLIIGNAGALVLVLKAVLDGTRCAPTILFKASHFFAAGLFLAFAGWVVGYLLSIRSLAIGEAAITATATVVANSASIAELEQQYGEHYRPGELEKQIDDAGEKLQELSGKTRWLWLSAAIPVVLFGLSALTFAGGVFGPLASSNVNQCAALKIEETRTSKEGLSEADGS